MPSVTRRSQSSRLQRRAQIRHRLLEVVEDLLDKGESYTELSVERLVSEAGISRSTFYVYFEDKGDLLRGWFEDIEAELAEAEADAGIERDEPTESETFEEAERPAEDAAAPASQE